MTIHSEALDAEVVADDAAWARRMREAMRDVEVVPCGACDGRALGPEATPCVECSGFGTVEVWT